MPIGDVEGLVATRGASLEVQEAEAALPPPVIAEAVEAWETRTSLFGDLDRS